MKPALRPVDRWIAFYNLILAVVWLGLAFWLGREQARGVERQAVPEMART